MTTKLRRHEQLNLKVDNRLRLGSDAMAKRNSLHLSDGVSLDDWIRVGEHIFIMSECSSWWFGDWLLFGQNHYPDRYKTAIAETSLDYQTLRNYAWVAGRFPPGRRRNALSFGHHAEVAALPEPDQDRWLERAEQSKWSRNRLRTYVRTERGLRSGRKPEPAERVPVEVPGDRLDRWRRAAELARLGLNEWITNVLDAAADDLSDLEVAEAR